MAAVVQHDLTFFKANSTVVCARYFFTHPIDITLGAQPNTPL